MLAVIHALIETYIFLSKKCFATVRNFLPQEEISCHSKKLLATGKKILVTRKKFLSQEKNSCHRKTILVTGRKFLAKVGNFMSQQILFHVNKHKFLEEISCTR